MQCQLKFFFSFINLSLNLSHMLTALSPYKGCIVCIIFKCSKSYSYIMRLKPEFHIQGHKYSILSNFHSWSCFCAGPPPHLISKESGAGGGATQLPPRPACHRTQEILNTVNIESDGKIVMEKWSNHIHFINDLWFKCLLHCCISLMKRIRFISVCVPGIKTTTFALIMQCFTGEPQ